MSTQYTVEVHHGAKNKRDIFRPPVTLRRVHGTKPVEIKRAERAAKKIVAI